MLLRHLGFEGRRTHFKAAVTVAAPVDFPAAGQALESSRRKLFVNFMIATGAKAFMLKGLVHSKFRDRVNFRRVLMSTRLSQIEEALICPLMGYATPMEYYKANDPRIFLDKISVPTLVVNAEDDPVISLHTLPFEELKRAPERISVFCLVQVSCITACQYLDISRLTHTMYISFELEICAFFI